MLSLGVDIYPLPTSTASQPGALYSASTTPQIPRVFLVTLYPLTTPAYYPIKTFSSTVLEAPVARDRLRRS